MPVEFVFDAIEAELGRRGIDPGGAARLGVSPTIPPSCRLSRSDQIANYDKLGGNAHAGLQRSTDFNPSTANLESHDRRITESRRWCEVGIHWKQS